MEKPPIQSFFRVSDENLYHGVSTDIVIMGYHDRRLKVLLQRLIGTRKWSLPGGYIDKRQNVETAAEQIVESRTGLRDLTLFQFGVYSEPGRIGEDKYDLARFTNERGGDVDLNHWIFQNVISICFCALVDFDKAVPSPNHEFEECRWWDLNSLPELIYDHASMIEGAMEYLKVRCYMKPIGKDLLPEKFTLPDLRSLYETILGKPLDDRNFSKKLTHIGLIEKLDERKKIGPHRSPYLYSFNTEVYDTLSKESSIIIMS